MTFLDLFCSRGDLDSHEGRPRMLHELYRALTSLLPPRPTSSTQRHSWSSSRMWRGWQGKAMTWLPAHVWQLWTTCFPDPRTLFPAWFIDPRFFPRPPRARPWAALGAAGSRAHVPFADGWKPNGTLALGTGSMLRMWRSHHACLVGLLWDINPVSHGGTGAPTVGRNGRCWWTHEGVRVAACHYAAAFFCSPHLTNFVRMRYHGIRWQRLLCGASSFFLLKIGTLLTPFARSQ